MEYEMTSGFMTLVLLIVFVAISGWAWDGRQRERFDAASRIPLEDDGMVAARSRPEDPR